jgi:hypothetical protein
MAEQSSVRRTGGGLFIACLIGIAIGVTQKNLVLGMAVGIGLAVMFSIIGAITRATGKS